MLTIFHMQNVLIIFDWCLCDFLVLKHIHEVYTLHFHLSLTDVDIFICGKYSNISVVCLIINWCWLFFLCKMFLLFLTDVYVIFFYWNISMKCMHFMFICHLLMFTYFCVEMFQNFNIVFDYLLILTIFHVQNVLIIFNWCMWFSCTETYWWSAHTSSSFVIDWCWHFCLCRKYSNISVVCLIITDVDYFSCAKCSYHFWLMSMWFSCTETYW